MQKQAIGPARFPVVGIGASAGGLEALEKFLAGIEADSGAAYVVVTHQAPDRPSLLPELLGKHTKLKVEVPTGVSLLHPNCVYVSPPGYCLAIQDGTLQVVPSNTHERHLPVDYFFRSLAKNGGQNAIAVVLSGNGTDGTLGITEVKGASGMVVAQTPDSARYAGMPSSAIATGLVDYVLPPEQMGAALRRYVAGRYQESSRSDSDREDDSGPALRRILSILSSRTGNDFAGYKKSTVERRVLRRMSLHGVASLEDYAEFLEETPSEVDALLKELLINVTSFFRDADAFRALERELVRLVEAKGDDTPLRIWVPGCATGEEAYSIAILVREIQRRSAKNSKAQVFATDLDIQAVEIARTGKYPEGIAADVTPERLERFFTKEDKGYRVSKEIRELLIFAAHNLVKDPPFTKLDVLSCRNLLIYLEPDLQKRVLALFSYALLPGGLLFLGTSESVSGFEDRFASVDKKWKLYQRRRKAEHAKVDLPAHLPGAPAASHASVPRVAPAPAVAGIGHIAERLLLGAFVPPSVLVDDRGELLFVHGRTGPFLEPAPGEPGNNVFHMAREGLRLELPAIVRQASKSEGAVVHRGLRVKNDGGFASVRVTARRLKEPEAIRGGFVISFEMEPEPERSHYKAFKRQQIHVSRIKSLEEELQRTKENLQGTIEEFETSNEELKSTNEELQSTNEELQSANEELETSREEMQSLNEELHTVNAEYEERNRALSQANDDMQNLLNSIEIATVFLDDKLAIKRFTMQAKKVFSLIDGDVGRPISDLTVNLRYDNLVEDARDVLRSLVSREREVQTKEGEWRLVRVMPYRTHENLIDGLVITFVDIDRIKRADQESLDARTFAEDIIEAQRDALLVLDQSLHVVSANQSFYDLFRTNPKVVVGERALQHVGDGHWDAPKLMQELEKVVRNDKSRVELSLDLDFPKIGRRSVNFVARRIRTGPDKPDLVLLAIQDPSGGETAPS